MLADEGKTLLAAWKGDILDQSVLTNSLVYKVPMWLRKTVFKWLSSFVSPTFSRCFSLGENHSFGLWRSVKVSKDLRYQLVKEMDQAGVDVLLAPGFSGPGEDILRIIFPTVDRSGQAIRGQIKKLVKWHHCDFSAVGLRDPTKLLPALSMTIVYNVLNVPVGSLPVSFYTEADAEDAVRDYPSRGDLTVATMRRAATVGAVGLPLNVQVIGRPWQEEV